MHIKNAASHTARPERQPIRLRRPRIWHPDCPQPMTVVRNPLFFL
jgi:hypothetical protein